MVRDQVFISYSHRDKKWLTRLQKMLKPLIRGGTIDVWADTEIKAGANWQEEIENALAQARVAVLLVSADFLASDFIVEEELPPLLRAAEEEGVTILWLYLSPCHFEETPIGDFQAAHDVQASLLELPFPKQQRALLEISRQIKEAAGKPLPAAPGSVPLKRLSQLEEVLTLPGREDGVARVLSLHLGPTTVIGRCYASQLREAARRSLEALDETRVHWPLAWDDERLNQLVARLWYQSGRDGSRIEIQNLTEYSVRPQSFVLTAEAGAEVTIRAGRQAELSLQPGRAWVLTTDAGSGRQQLARLVAETVERGDARFQVLRTTTSFLFPPTGGDEATLVRYLGCWVPLALEELAAYLSDAEPVVVRFARAGLQLSIQSAADGLRVSANNFDLARVVEEQECAGDPADSGA